MAGDWIKVENVTPDKPEVHEIAARLKLEPDSVLGKLIRVWVWADQQTYDGHAGSVTKILIDRLTDWPGFADAMLAVGWLIESGERLTFPRFDRHNGQSGKARAVGQKRQEKYRSKHAARAITNRCHAGSVTRPLPEKKREEQEKPPTPSKLITPDDEWGEAEAALFEAGVAKAADCIATAKALGSTPKRVRDIVEHWRELLKLIPNRWKSPPAVLCLRLLADRPPLPIADGWPPADPIAVQKADDGARRNLKAKEERQQTAALKRDGQSKNEMERRYGGEWDEMDAGERRRIAQTLLSNDTYRMVHRAQALMREQVFNEAANKNLPTLKSILREEA